MTSAVLKVAFLAFAPRHSAAAGASASSTAVPV
jgi:hypothetical protein